MLDSLTEQDFLDIIEGRKIDGLKITKEMMEIRSKLQTMLVDAKTQVEVTQINAGAGAGAGLGPVR